MKILLASVVLFLALGTSQSSISGVLNTINTITSPITKVVSNVVDTVSTGVSTVVNTVSNAVSNAVNYQSDYNVTLMNQLELGLKLTGVYVGDLLTDTSSVNVTAEVTFWCINSKTRVLQQTFLNDPNITDKILPGKPVVFVTHGWIDNVRRTWVQNILNSNLSF